MITYCGKRRTPKEMAAIVVGNLLELAPEDWVPAEAVTEAERQQILHQVRRYQERIWKLLQYDPSAKG